MTTPVDRLLLGVSDAIEQVRDAVRRLSQTRGPLLITGEVGAGKSMVAEAIRAEGGDGPYVSVFCGCVPPDEVEARFFGFDQRGGGYSSLPEQGLLEEAAGGTLCLENIGNLPQPMQGKLLRVLEPEVDPDSIHFPKRLLDAPYKQVRREVRDALAGWYFVDGRIGPQDS